MEVHFDVGAVDPESAKRNINLRGKLIAIIAPAVAENVLAAFRTSGGIRHLSENGKGLAERYILFDPASPLWADPLNERFYRTLTAARESPVGSEICLALFELVLVGLKSNLEAVDARNLKRSSEATCPKGSHPFTVQPRTLNVGLECCADRTQWRLSQ
jgi:hypothetical protein